MELRHLRSFVAVAETLSFRRAAENLHVSPPALSKQIKLLEEGVGVRLFNRDTTRVTLTNGGAILLEHAKDLLQRARLAVQLAREAGTGSRGTLRIGNWGGLVISQFLPKWLAAYSRRFPGAQFMPMDYEQADPFHSLTKRIIDIGFLPYVEPYSFPAFVDHLVVVSTPLYLMVGQGHRLAKRRSIAPRLLLDETLAFRRGCMASIHTRSARYALSKVKQPLRNWTEVVGWESLCALVSSGRAVTLVGATSKKSGRPGTVLIPLTGPRITVHFAAVWRRSEASSVVKDFVSVLERGRVKPPPATQERPAGSGSHSST